MKRAFLLAIVLLTACAPRASTPDADQVRAQVATSVALTVSAHYTEEAVRASPTPVDTATPLPTFTPLPTLPPLPSQTPASSVPAAAEFRCAVVAKQPYDNTPFHPNTDFDIKFSIKNIGTRAWAYGADLLFSGGTNMLKANTRYELPDVQPGQVVGPFVFDARAPLKPGTYVMTFKVQGGFCYPYVRIVVKR
jgi:hypothetical protein